MAVPFDTPVSAIEGIGPATERLFQARGVFTVYDLLRAQSPELHGAVASVASQDQVRSWRQMAVLLEVAAMTPQWAEALVRGGVHTLTELRYLALAELQTIFTAAQGSGLIPDLPTTDQMIAMLTDATLLEFGGAITGTVKDRDGQPVAGATVTAGGAEASTDPRGRFRIRRLLLGSNVSVAITKDSFLELSAPVAPVRTTMVGVVQFTLQPAIAGRPRPSGQAAGALSELGGDTMPPMQGQDFTSHEVPLASLAPQDLVTLTAFYANGTDAKLVSKLLEFDGRRFIAHWVRLPKSALPDAARIGDHFIISGGGFRRVAMNAAKLNRYKAYLRARRSRAAAPLATTPGARYAQAAEVFRSM